jgi:hypothetical protein
MTDGQSETLRQDLRAPSCDLNQRIGSVEPRLAKLEGRLDAKPGKAFASQTLFTINTSFSAMIGLAPLVLRGLLVP